MTTRKFSFTVQQQRFTAEPGVRTYPSGLTEPRMMVYREDGEIAGFIAEAWHGWTMHVCDIGHVGTRQTARKAAAEVAERHLNFIALRTKGEQES